MTTMVSGDSTLESLTPSVNAPLLSKCGYFFLRKKAENLHKSFPKQVDDFVGLERKMWQILRIFLKKYPLDHVARP
jgi:hypothetical protein